MQVTMEIKKGEFVNRDGEVISYYSYTAELMGETVKFTPKETDKKLVEHLLKGCEVETVKDEGERAETPEGGKNGQTK